MSTNVQDIDVAIVRAALAAAILQISELIEKHQESEKALCGHIEELQALIDSRPALNADLISAYTKWTHMIYAKEMQYIFRQRKKP